MLLLLIVVVIESYWYYGFFFVVSITNLIVIWSSKVASLYFVNNEFAKDGIASCCQLPPVIRFRNCCEIRWGFIAIVHGFVATIGGRRRMRRKRRGRHRTTTVVVVLFVVFCHVFVDTKIV